MPKKKIIPLSEVELILIDNFRDADPFGQEFLLDAAMMYASVNRKLHKSANKAAL